MLYVNTYFDDESFCEVLRAALADQINIKLQPLMTILYITCYYLLYRSFENKDTFLQLCKFVSLNIGSNTSFSRYLSQYIITRLIDEKKLDLADPDIGACDRIMHRNRDNMILVNLFHDILAKYNHTLANLSLLTMLQTRFFGEKLEIAHGYICDQFKEVSIQNAINQTDDSAVIKPEAAVTQALDAIYGEMQQAAQDEDDAVFQRKIDNILSIFPVADGSVKRNSEIVVVASLVEKLPNLANLTRTCEVFGVKELVIPSKGILKDPAFLNVTVTAEKWLPFVECAPENLAQMLMMYKENNYKVAQHYQIIALEQTSKSRKLSEFVFPDRTVLLLGKEREGIPFRLLQVTRR
jgi:tRNA G18 (ribose-2'-O)-methylase SpoU